MVLRQLNDTDADLALSASENAIIGAALTTFEDGETVDLLWCQSCDTDYSRLVANAAKDDMRTSSSSDLRGLLDVKNLEPCIHLQ